MKVGIVGLPNVGKSTVFNALTRLKAECANYPFCTIEPNVGIAPVKDERLEVLGEIFNTKRIVPAILEIVDIAGLVKGASSGEGLGNKFLSHIHQVDAIIHMVRCFFDPLITHVENTIDPIRDIEIINLELILADYESVKRRREKCEKLVKTGEKKYLEEAELLIKIEKCLNDGKPVRSLKLTQAEMELAQTFFLLTLKPVIYCANCTDDEVSLSHWKKVEQYANAENSVSLKIFAKTEEELSSMSENDLEFFKKELGIEESGLNAVVSAGYKALNLISFLTAGEKECRAWTIEKGTKAPQAGGKIHSDFERGFIRAEVISYEDLKTLKTYAHAKEKGKVRSEGKDYVVLDGDVIIFRFNV